MHSSNLDSDGQAMKRKTEADLCMEHVLTELVPHRMFWPEFKFDTDRKFSFDYAIPALSFDYAIPALSFDYAIPALRQGALAIEINGGAWSRGRHVRGAGFIRDMEKLNLAQIFGWDVLQFTPQQVLDGTAKEVIKRWLESHR